jgi:hypothetical protein
MPIDTSTDSRRRSLLRVPLGLLRCSPGTEREPPASGYAEMNLYPGDPPNCLTDAPAESVDPELGLIRDVSMSEPMPNKIAPPLRRF